MILENNIQGWMHIEELEFLFDKAKTMNNIVEVGSWKGRTTKVLLDTGKNIFAVDTFHGSADPKDGTYNMAKESNILMEFLNNVGYYTNLNILCMPSNLASTYFSDKSIDMVFIDAEHTYLGVLNDIDNWLPKTKKLICGHDYSDNWPSVKDAVNTRFGNSIQIVDRIWYKELI